MRILSTIILGALTAVVFSAFFALHSLLGYIESPKQVAGTAERLGLHELAGHAAERVLMDEMRAAGIHDDRLREFVKQRARKVFDEVLSKEWFHSAIVTGYGGVLAILHDKPGDHRIDLLAKKAELQAGLAHIAGDVAAQCKELSSAAVCINPGARNQLLRPVEAALARALAEIPDEIDIERVAYVAGRERWLAPDSPQLRRARQALAIARIARYVALGAMLLFFLAIGISNRPPLSSMVIALGLVATLSSVAFLVGARVVDDRVVGPYATLLQERARVQVDRDARVQSVGDIAARGVATLTRGVARDVIHGSDNAVTALGALGLSCVVFGVLIRRRRPQERVP